MKWYMLSTCEGRYIRRVCALSVKKGGGFHYLFSGKNKRLYKLKFIQTT